MAKERISLGYVQATLATLLVGSGITTASLLKNASPFLTQGMRYLIGAILLIPLVLREEKVEAKLTKVDYLHLLLVAGLGVVAFSTLGIVALRHIDPPGLAIIIGAAPIAIGIFGPIIDKRRPTLRPVIGAVVVLIGTVIVEGNSTASLFGYLLALIVMACDASFSIFSVGVVKKIGPYRLSLITISFGAIVLLGYEAITSNLNFASLSNKEYLIIAYQGIFSTFGAFALWYQGMSKVKIESIGLFPGLIPVGALITTFFVGLSPKRGIVDVIGVAISVAGIATGLTNGKRGKAADTVAHEGLTP